MIVVLQTVRSVISFRIIVNSWHFKVTGTRSTKSATFVCVEGQKPDPGSNMLMPLVC